MNRLFKVAPAVLLALVLAEPARAEITYTSALGGTGGAYFDDSCRPGDLLIGFDFSSSKALNTVKPACIAVQNAAWTGREYSLQTWGQAPDSHRVFGSPRCPGNQYVTALHVWWDKFGIVHHIRMFCHDLARTQITTMFTYNSGGQPNQDGSAPCPRGQFGVGMIGGHGALIDRIGLKCQQRSP